MKTRIWNWAAETIQSNASAIKSTVQSGMNDAYNYVSSTRPYQYLSSAVSFTKTTANHFFSHPKTQRFRYNFSIKLWEGSTRFLDPYNITKLFPAEKTRETLWENLRANGKYYLSLAVAVE